jgi:tRNA G18 (ribose-2'-O)-methylase SpoU
MTVEHLADADDPRVAEYRGMLDADLVRARGLFVAEGRLIVRRVIEDARFRVRSVLVNDAAARDLAPVFAALASSTPVLVGDPATLHAIAGYDVHRGCLALVERPPARAVADVLAARSLVILEGVANPDNIGGVFRNAAAFGAGGVLLSPACGDPLYRKAIRTSMGAVLRVPYARVSEEDGWPAVLNDVRAAGFTIVALTPREPSESIEAFAARTPPSRVALVLGTEGEGLTPAVEAAADVRVRIPIGPDVDSLNLSVAAGIALHLIRSAALLGLPGRRQA